MISTKTMEPATHQISPMSSFFDKLIKQHCPTETPKDPAAADWTNWSFIKAFDRFESYAAVADFLHDWIKAKKGKDKV